MTIPPVSVGLPLVSAVIPPSGFGLVSTGRSGCPPHPIANNPALETSATNASDRFTHEQLVIMSSRQTKIPRDPKRALPLVLENFLRTDFLWVVLERLVTSLCATR